jgi:AraC-like DNA-binding protein
MSPFGPKADLALELGTELPLRAERRQVATSQCPSRLVVTRLCVCYHRSHKTIIARLIQPQGLEMFSQVRTFSDPHLCESALQSVSQAELLPTARGDFKVELTQVAMNKLRMQRIQIDLPQVSSVAVERDRKAVAFLVEPSSPALRHSGLEVTQSDIFLYEHDVAHVRSMPNSLIGTMSLPMDDFPRACEAIIGSVLLEKPRHSVVRPNPGLLSRLRELHRTIGKLAHDAADILELSEVQRALTEKLVHALVRCLADGTGVETTIGERRHSATIALFRDFLAANPDSPLYLTEICAALGVAERTLRASCEEHLGMGPIRFLTLRRMHLVRRALLGADPAKSTVTKIVTDHGFWELGRFSVAYRTLFGETPSTTLRRSDKISSPLVALG